MSVTVNLGANLLLGIFHLPCLLSYVSPFLWHVSYPPPQCGRRILRYVCLGWLAFKVVSGKRERGINVNTAENISAIGLEGCKAWGEQKTSVEDHQNKLLWVHRSVKCTNNKTAVKYLIQNFYERRSSHMHVRRFVDPCLMCLTFPLLQTPRRLWGAEYPENNSVRTLGVYCIEWEPEVA